MKKILLLVTLTFLSAPLFAENSKTENGYEVHYNAFSTDFLTPKVAKQYNIGRSRTKGMINIAVRKLHKGDTSTSTAATARIDLKIQNLYGQQKEVTLRKISENNDEAIYYIGTFSVSSRETLNFKASVTPNGERNPIEIKFSQEFFTD